MNRLRNSKYCALVGMGVTYSEQWDDTKQRREKELNECNDIMAVHYLGEMRDFGTRLQACGDIADQIFKISYNTFMADVHNAKEARKCSLGFYGSPGSQQLQARA